MNVEAMTQTIDFRWHDIPIPYRCEGCPYPRVGFTCRDRDGNCTRTDVERVTERQRKIRESIDVADTGNVFFAGCETWITVVCSPISLSIQRSGWSILAIVHSGLIMILSV